MKVTKKAMPDVLVIEPQIFKDERGFFFRELQRPPFRRIDRRDGKLCASQYFPF